MDTFKNCISFETISFPQTLQEISFDSFNGCESLTSIQFPPTFMLADYNFSVHAEGSVK